MAHRVPHLAIVGGAALVIIVLGAIAADRPKGGDALAVQAERRTVEAVDIAFRPARLTIPANRDVTIILPNNGNLPHSFRVDALGIDVDIAPGETKDTVVNAKPGALDFYCDVPGHKQAGMVGTLIAELIPPGATPTVTPRPIDQGPVLVPPSSDRDLASLASDIFIGRVVVQTPGTPTAEPAWDIPGDTRLTPNTLYTVDVLDVLKGSASGTVVVRQPGIFDDAFQWVRDDAPHLKPGETALFATRSEPDGQRYELLYGRFGYIRLATDEERAAIAARFAGYLGTPVAATPRSGTPHP